jgi:hypothetical protein
LTASAIGTAAIDIREWTGWFGTVNLSAQDREG